MILRGEVFPIHLTSLLCDFAIADHVLIPLAVLASWQQSEETQTKPVSVKVWQCCSVRRRGNNEINLVLPLVPQRRKIFRVSFLDGNVVRGTRAFLSKKRNDKPH